jgi:hypothetical protein
LTSSRLREPELPLSPNLSSVTLFILPASRILGAKLAFSAAC